MSENRARLLILKLSAETRCRNYSQAWALEPLSPRPPQHNSCKTLFVVLLWPRGSAESSLLGQQVVTLGANREPVPCQELLMAWHNGVAPSAWQRTGLKPSPRGMSPISHLKNALQ